MSITTQTVAAPSIALKAADKKAESYGLQSKVLSPFETLAQSVASIAPTGTPTLVVPLVFALAGPGTWLAYLISMVGILFIASSVNQFARRSASPGALYTYIAQGAGPAWGAVAGWALFIAYIGTSAAVTSGFSNYANVLLNSALGFKIPSAFFIAICVVFSWWIGYKDIKLSTRLMLFIEFASVGLIFFLVGATIVQHGIHLDWDQLSLKGTTFTNLRLGLVLATFSYVGFEAATSLGSEAKNPLRNIPRAVTLSAAAIGILFVLASYVETLAFKGNPITLDKSDAPLQVVATAAHLSFLGTLINIGALLSFFACTLATLNAAARVLFLMSRHGIFHASVANAHQVNETPHVAVSVSAVLVLLPAVILSLRGVGDFDIYGWVGTVATISIILVYIGVAIAAPIYLHRRNELKTRNLVISAVGILFMVNGLVGNLYPIPPAPYNWLPYFTFALLIGGGFWYLALRHFSPEVANTIDRDLAAIDERYKDGAGI
jgi:amino acid transporter